MGHRLPTSVRSLIVVHDVDISKNTRQGRPIATIEHHIKVGTSDFIAPFKSFQRRSLRVWQLLPSRESTVVGSVVTMIDIDIAIAIISNIV